MNPTKHFYNIVKSDVPQRRVLGPLLFYMNDINKYLSSRGKLRMFKPTDDIYFLEKLKRPVIATFFFL